MAEKRLIDADALIQYLTDWKNDLDGKSIGSLSFAINVGASIRTLNTLLDWVKENTYTQRCTCQKWHPSSETPPLHHKVDEDKCEGPLEYDVSEPLLLYTEEEGYKVGVYMKDCYGFNGWLNPEYGGTIHHVVEWQYLPKSSKEKNA